MLQKKFYIPIGILILVICAVGLLSLRSDTPTEPIKIYKVVEPAEESETQTATATRDTAEGGHYHADGNLFHAEQQPPSTAQVSETEGNTEASENIAFGGDIAAETPRLSKEEFEEKFKEELAEQRYDIAAAEYYRAMQEYYKKDQELAIERRQLSDEYDKNRKDAEIALKNGSKAEKREVMDRIITWQKALKANMNRREALRKTKPIAPTPPAGYGPAGYGKE